LKELASHHRISLAQLVARLDAERQEEGNLSSALRLAVLAYYRDRT
jgi:predicted DNA-binding ribbon-helix-helix protein